MRVAGLTSRDSASTETASGRDAPGSPQARRAAGGYEVRKLSGWGRYPAATCHLYRPEKRSTLSALLASGAEPSYIARGMGRSYGDAAINASGGVIAQERLNRFLSFDPESGILECEAGVTFAEIIEHLLPRGFFPPVTPGTKFVTLGGAIAADVHGKNHHRDGSFVNFILSLDLLTATGETLHCSPQSNHEVFWATVGGMGLTGIILRARLRLRKVETSYVKVNYQRARNLEQVLDSMAAGDEDCQYSVAWIDCLARGRSLGRSVLMRGDHAIAAQLPHFASSALEPPLPPRFNVPMNLPSFALNSFSVRAFNALYYALHGEAASRVVYLDPFFYPLDKINNWNRLYGKRGFVQYQVAVPFERGEEALAALLYRLSSCRKASFLAVLKRFGAGNEGLLSFPMPGYTLALDIPYESGLGSFLHELDDIVVGYGGRIYLAKDALQEPRTFAAGYQRLQRFQAIKKNLDPRGIFSSSLERRLKIVPGAR
ncbi:MAG TPA: FAD-binding oxidoreductase [Terriglobia bacterium]|nr:FAD-binding oxidoreductase [Terriglobia bacterium]